MKQRFLILVILLAPLLTGFTPDRQQPTLSLDVSAGYGGFYERGQWTPVRVTVANSGADLSGYVRVRMGELGGLEETVYRTPLDLPRDSRKQIFLYISVENYTQNVQVEVVNEHGHIVERARADLRMVNRGDALYAVITASVYGAVDLTGESVGNGEGRQVNWRIEDIPPMAEALAGLDVILFHDVDTGTLRPEQIAALSQWVLSGGHLIVTGGDAWQRTTAHLDSLLPGRVQGSTPLESAAALGAYLRQPSAVLDEPITAAVIVPDESARILASSGEYPLIVRGPYGAGWVDFLAVDPHAAPLRSWTGRADLWYILIASTGQKPSWSDGFSEWSMARDATLTTGSSVLPTFFQLCGFLVAYIVLIGPVNYLVLKRLNHREWAWYTIPATIVLFSLLAYQVGFNLRGNVPVINRLTVVRAWAGEEHSQVMTLIGVQSPRRLYYDIAVEQGVALRTLPDEGIGINVPVTINEGTRYEAQDILIDGGTVASLIASGYAAGPRLEAAAEWRLQPGKAPRIMGAVTNTSEILLEDAVVLVKGEARALGSLEPGATTTFDIALGPQSPGPLTLGTTYLWQRPYSYGSWRAGNPYSACFFHGGEPLTLPHVMQGEQFACSITQVTPRQHEIRRRYRLLGALVVDQDESGGRDSGAYVFAWTQRQPGVEVTLGARKAVVEDTALYVFELPITVADSGQRIEVPPGLTTWTVTETDDPQTIRDVHPELTFQVDSHNRAAFEFMPMTHMRLARVDQVMVEFKGQGDVLVELWDWDDQFWDEVVLADNSDVTVIRNAARFAGPENAVRVRVSAPSSVSYNRVQTVRVGYRGWLG